MNYELSVYMAAGLWAYYECSWRLSMAAAGNRVPDG